MSKCVLRSSQYRQDGLSSPKKALLTSSAAAAFLMALGVTAPVAHAQITITDGQTTTVFDPNGTPVDAPAGVTQTIADTPADDDPDNGNIVLDAATMMAR